jgi:hypothetical protein
VIDNRAADYIGLGIQTVYGFLTAVSERACE